LESGIQTLLQQHEKFIEEYDDVIREKVCYDVSNINDRDDVSQHVRMALIKSFKSRYKYDDWDNVVRSIIKRRIRDYLKKTFRQTNNLTNEYTEENTSGEEFFYEEKGFNEFIVREQLDVIKKRVESNKKHFDSMEYEYFEVICEIYECGFIVDDELIMQNMGLDISNSSDRKSYRKISKGFIEKMSTIR
jgi:hypothetical protein